METQFWRKFALYFLIVNTFCSIILIELFVTGTLYVSAFLALFFILAVYNWNRVFSVGRESSQDRSPRML